MKTTICPFSKTEVESYMQKAFAYVDSNHPTAKGADWDEKVKEGLRVQYAKGNDALFISHDAHMFADLVFEGYYED